MRQKFMGGKSSSSIDKSGITPRKEDFWDGMGHTGVDRNTDLPSPCPAEVGSDLNSSPRKDTTSGPRSLPLTGSRGGRELPTLHRDVSDPVQGLRRNSGDTE